MNKAAIYTAIVGNYDDLPEVGVIYPDIDYICFADTEIKAVHPWRIVYFKRIYADPQREARRIKLLPHLFLPEYIASLWIDANVRIENCSADYILKVTNKNVIACAKHRSRE